MFSPLRRALLPATLLLALAVAPAAHADTFACNAIPAIDDGFGGVWWSASISGSANAKQFGELEIAVTHGASSSTDAYDTYGALFVGATRYDAGAGSCERTVTNGRTTIRYPEVAAANGLLVRRSITFDYVNLGGGRFVHFATLNNIVRNPTGAPIVSDVTVGDAAGTTGSLGSDASPPATTTNTITTSSGDATATTTDDWAITADAIAGSGGTDPVLFHGWGQTFGGGDRPEEVGSTGSSAVDDWHTKWSAVSVAAGATASYQTIEAATLSDPKSVSNSANDLQSALGTLSSTGAYLRGAGLTAAEIGGSRNVQPPRPSVDTPAPDRAAVGEGVQLILDASENDGIAGCQPVTSSLTYDGTQVLSAPGSVTPIGTAGSHPYTATATNACGQSTTQTGSVVVSGTTTSCYHAAYAGGGLPLFDGNGGIADFNTDGSLYDGGSNKVTPAVQDSYDSALELTVGGTQFSPDSTNGCNLEAGGRQFRTESSNVAGLDVSRTTYAASNGPGARLAIFLRNPTAAPITVPVQVGRSGSLGSDNNTNVVATGNGTTTVTPAARWMVTDDDDGVNDAALAHVWDGAGGADAADSVVLTEPAHPTDKDDYEVTYDSVTVAPGATVGYVLWEGQRVRSPRAVGERDDAVATANTLAGLSGIDLYAGMTGAEIASVRNWAHPAPTGTLTGPATGTVGTPQTFTVSGLSGGAGIPACGGTVAWAVDGATLPGNASLTTSFAAVGAHTVTATITGDCGGGSLVRTAAFTASAAQVPPPAATVKISGLKVVGSCLKAPKRSVTIKAGATVAVATKATLKIQKLVGKAKTCVKSTSAAGKKLLKGKGAKTVFTKTGKVAKGKVSFTVKARTVRSGKAKVVKGVLVLSKGAYRLVISSGTKATATLVIVT